MPRPLRGTYRQRKSGWSVTYDKPGIEGKRQQVTEPGFATQREAEEWFDTTIKPLRVPFNGRTASRERSQPAVFVITITIERRGQS